jgi:signal transduction histidine kinase
MVAPTPAVSLENLEQAQLLEKVRRLLAEADSLSSRISAVNEIGIAINRTLDLATIQRVIAKQAKWLLDFAHLSVCLKDDQAGEWRATTLFGPDEQPSVALAETDNIGPVLQSGQPRLIHQGSPSPFLSGYASQLIIPLIATETTLGTINFAAARPNCYTYDDMRIGYMLSLQLSAAIRNAYIFAELQRTQDELHQRVEELDAYAHTIAHDLKTPLSNVILWSDLFKMMFEHRVPEESLKYIDTIRNNGHLMHHMIDQLLLLAQIRHTAQAYTRVAVAETVQRALERFARQVEDARITVTVAPGLPDALGHQQWIEEIFANLISNAIKYMGTGSPAPRIEIHGALAAGQARFEVRDTGIGIKPEDQKRLFEKFARLHIVHAEGIGLGLSIIHRMIKKMGGDIGIESTFGEGSTFWFVLPAAPIAIQHDTPTPAETKPPLEG